MLWGASQWTRLLISQAPHTRGHIPSPIARLLERFAGFYVVFLWHVVGKRLNLMRNKQVGDEQRHIIISTHNVIRHRVEAAYWGIGSSLLGWGGNGVVTESVYFNITLRWRMQVSRRNCNILAISGGKAQLDFTALLGIHPSIHPFSINQPSVLCKQAEEEEAP